jgi:hypothetical protein
MSFEFYGIAAAQNPDLTGETIMIDGIDVSAFKSVIDEHSMLGQQTQGTENGSRDAYGMWSLIGAVKKYKKIMSLKDCDTQEQKRCYRQAGVPFLFVEGTLFDKHPNAQAAASIIQECLTHSDGQLQMGLSIEGGIGSRASTDPKDKDFKTIETSVANGVALTISPCNPRCVLFVKNDLQKSFKKKPLSQKYQELVKSQFKSASSIVSSEQAMTKSLIKSLTASRQAMMDMIAVIKCNHCGDSQYYKRTIDQLPARCCNQKCRHAYTMSHMLQSYKNKIGENS